MQARALARIGRFGGIGAAAAVGMALLLLLQGGRAPGDDVKGPPAVERDSRGAAPAPAEATAPVHEFHVYSVDGELEFADGNATYVVGFANYDDAFGKAPEPIDKARLSKRLTVPGPELRVKKGERVRVVLHNAGLCHAPDGSGFLGTPHTIHFHGLDLLAPIDGVPDLPAPGVPEGQEYTYEFVPDFEGTYLYHCHVDSASHILLGMYGVVVVEGDEPKTIYGRHYDREYTLVLSEMDTHHNEVLRTKGRMDMLTWKSDYFLINGRIFSANLKNPLSSINDPKTRIVCKVGETVLLRVSAIANNHTFVLHPHAYHFEVIGTDGRALPAPYFKDTLPVTSGERYDLLVKIGEKHKGACQSCNIGKGVSIMHDHNMGGMTSAGKYPQGALTIFEVQ
ncbi:MAG: multicopper oxidase domain-containing protein [Planctomycetes bacterium]|nr:multicopper oxidase domain-containing protein [Planctomycetota bacterium]